MFDRIFSGVLAFGVLAAATLAIGTAFFERPARAETPSRVEVTVKRVAAAQALARCDHAAVTQMR
jgi:hypothetical protein